MPLLKVKYPVLDDFSGDVPVLGDEYHFDGSLWVPGTPPAVNVLWQGGMQVWQDGPFTGLGASSKMINDGWKFDRDNTTGRVSISPDSQVQCPPGKSMLIQCTTAHAPLDAGSLMNVSARIEGNDLAALGLGTVKGLPMNLSFWVYSSTSAAGTYPVWFWVSGDGGATYRYYKFTFTVVQGWNYIQKTIPVLSGYTVTADSGVRGLVGIQLAAGTTYVDNNVNQWFSTGFAGGVTGQKNFLDSTGNRLDIAAMQLTLGAVARPFQTRIFSDLMTIAQRNYEKTYSYQIPPGKTQEDPGVVCYKAGTVDNIERTDFATAKRIPPTVVTIYNWNNGTTGTCRDVSNGVDKALATQYFSESGFCWSNSNTFTAGALHKWHWVCDIRS